MQKRRISNQTECRFFQYGDPRWLRLSTEYHFQLPSKFARRTRRCIRQRRHTLFAEPIDEPQTGDAQPVPDGVAAGRPGAAGRA